MSELGSLGEMGVMFQRAPFLDLLTESLTQDTGIPQIFPMSAGPKCMQSPSCYGQQTFQTPRMCK